MEVFFIANNSKEVLINEAIREKEVRVVDATGQQLGIMSSRQALELAQQKGLDLVNIAPHAKPPVCRIMDYGKYRYEQAKREKEARKNQKVVEIKEVRLSMTIDVNDINIKAKNAVKFLKEGNKVKVSLRMRGRQTSFASHGVEVMNNFFESLGGTAVMEKKPATEGRSIIMILAPAKQ